MRCVGIALLCALSLCSLGNSIHGRSYGPRTRTLISCPRIEWNVWSDRAFESLTMRLNGTVVAAHYSSDKQLLTYQPTEPLAPAEYRVECHAEGGGAVLNKSWKFVVDPEAKPLLPPLDQDSVDAFAAVNRLRQRIGMPEFSFDARLAAAARAHVEYLVTNQASGHFQQIGSPGYFGANPEERLGAYGYYGDSWEIVNVGATSAQDALDSLFRAPYHRLTLLQPGPVLGGCGYSKGCLDFTTDIGKTQGWVTSPFSDERNVECSWNGRERPDPLRIHGAVGVCGYPIVVALYPLLDGKLSVSEATLSLDSKPVSCYLNTPENDDRLTNALFLIPKEPLLGGSTYRVRVVASRGQERFEKEWSFTTK